MKDILNVLAGLSESVENAHPQNNEDYINTADGLLYCGKCHTPKQCHTQFKGSILTQFCLCACEIQKCEADRAAFEKQQLENEIHLLKLHSGMTRQQLSECHFDRCDTNNDNQKQIRSCLKYAANFETMLAKNQGLLLWGGVGTGKTFTAACIANALLDEGIPVIMTSFARLLGTGKGFVIDEEYIAELNRAKLLIIDDLGAERSTDFALEKVYSIIDSRYRASLPMILTTNLDLDSMQECGDIRYKRVYERVLEVCYPIKFEGNSRRKDKAKDRFAEMREFLET